VASRRQTSRFRATAGPALPANERHRRENLILETEERAASTLLSVADVADRASAAEPQHRRVRGWLSAARSARARILIAYVALLALAGVVALVGFRQFLLIRLEDEVDRALRQEVRELDLLLTNGRDPETGRPFASLEALFDVYFARNVPSREEAFLGFVEGELHRMSSLASFPLERLPSEALADWERLASRSPGEADGARGRIGTKLGDAHFRTARIRFEDDVGAFVVTILPASGRQEIRNFVAYGGAAALVVLLLASACAWLISGRVLEPVRLLTDTARSISESDLTRRIEVRGTGEAADMARSFNAMLDRLEAVFQSQREFVRDTNHELRDPLTIVRGQVQLMGDDPEERRRAAKLVLDELDRMSRIVDDLKLLADVEQPGFLRSEWTDVGAFTHELVSKGTALAPREWVVDDVADGAFFADRQRLTQAVMNLVHNAVHHTAESDTIAIGTSVNDREVRVSVRDTGTGISVSDQATIFDRFARGSDAHLRYSGSGLGLAIVKAIAEAHGGRVELKSRLGEGSTFTIVVPREPSEGGPDSQDPDR
jgi:two-component system OmpR family sensor kinase